MKLKFIIFCMFIFLLTGCSQNHDKVEKNSVVPQESNPSSSHVVKKDIQTQPSNQKEKGTSVYKEYRPKVGTIRTFTENGEEIFSEEVIAENNDFVQILVTLGNSMTTEIYKWTDDEITLLFQETDLDDNHQNMLTNFKQMGNIETILGSGENLTWKVIKMNAHVTVPSGTYDHVYVVQKTTNEVVNEKTIYTRYYAPNVGMIKEEVEQTGKAGYKETSSLAKIK